VESSFKLGIYGKTGKTKGTDALQEATLNLARQDFPFLLHAHWGGKHLDDYVDVFTKPPLNKCVQIEGFIPHWNIPDFIRSMHVILFLENRFRITFHQPGIPLEALACGRPVITTEEIASKPLYRELLKEDGNAFIISGKVNAENIEMAILRAHDSLKKKKQIMLPPILPGDVHIRVQMYDLIEAISLRIK
jgi:glycosyltransferase involved in cell wall biosynthesis